ncbi:hypothetical protein [Vibrio maritimus]|uniref:hypothetical protein n=1 Tax=Vibrio maritimus TaxID=990268 RepID=UPI0037359D24
MTKDKKNISHRVVYSTWDFQQALSALTFLREECDYQKKYPIVQLRRFRCFENTIIVSFSRPFKVGRGREYLDLSQFGISLNQDELDIKKKILTLRDKVVSHSDEEQMEYDISSIKISDDSNLRMPTARFKETLYLEESELLEIEKLLHKLIDALAIFQFELVQSAPNEFKRTKKPRT